MATLPPAPPRPREIAQATGLVNDVLATAQSLAATSMSRGLAAIEALGTFGIDIPEIVVPDIAIPAIDLPAAGEAPAAPADLTVSLPAPPTDPVQGDIGALDLGAAPAYTVTAPLLIDIPLPDPLDAVAPAAPDLPGVVMPVEPDFTLPDVPTFASLNIPNAPTFEAPTFDEAAPDAPLPIDTAFAWAEVDYASDNLALLNTRLLDLVAGETPTALPPEVEDAIWHKGLDAEAMASWQAADSALQQVAARGFVIPGGQLIRIVQQVVADGLAKDAELSRQIMVEQARLEQANFQFAFGNAMQLEGQLIGLFNQVQQRALDAAKFRIEAVTQLFNARVLLYRADVEAFGSKIEVFKVRMQAALATLEVYKAQLAAAKITGDLNVQIAQQYAAQIDSLKIVADVFRARVEAVSLAVEQNKNRTELFRAAIDGYAATAKANAQGVSAYLSQIAAEQAKAELFSTEVAGYTSRVEAYKTLTDAKLAEATLQFQQLQQFPIERYKGRIAGYQAQISGEAARLNATADIFTSRVEAYAAVSRVGNRHAAAQAEIGSTTTKLYASQAQVALQAGEANLKMSLTRGETAQAALRAAGQLSTQLASAAMSARNVSASLSGSVANSASQSVSNSVSDSSSNNQSFSASTSRNFSTTTGTSHSATASISNSQSMSNNQTASDTVNTGVSNTTTQSHATDTERANRNTTASSMNWQQRFSKETIYLHKD